MEKNTIKDGTRIEFAGQAGHTTLYAKGWYDVSLDNGTFAKARRKDLVVLAPLPDPEDRCPGCGNRNRACSCGKAFEPVLPEKSVDPQALEPSQAVEDSGTLNTENMELHCPNCENLWTPKRLKLSIQCPKCGTWVRVRIKADLTHYVRGLGETPSGHDTLDIGDGTSDLLRGLTTEDILIETAVQIDKLGEKNMSKSFLKEFKKQTGGAWDLDTIQAFLADRYQNRNNGMVRMNCGNILRAAQIRAEGQK